MTPKPMQFDAHGHLIPERGDGYRRIESNRYQSQVDALKSCEDKLSSIYRWIEKHHPDGFIDSQSYTQNLDRIFDSIYDRLEEAKQKIADPSNIFEIVDVSDEAAFYTIGIFLSLDEAVRAIEAKAQPWTLCDNAMYAGDYASMEIRSRRIGLDPLNNGAVVWKRAWNNVYDEDKDDNDWRVIIPNAESDR